ncbi:hypothetical protein CRM22_010490 [Opisthorchis felineus]|uniref:C2H2-type domain-containing protein n=1 Tax=Opisthorchis felineus TaxID=147828 RepID=A0A4S2KY56_OPIFE|nr:hypothetical protein CRM22_010490 [Opisthorchis felineus]TGZ55105.1 hypothetical protein CRM22_010490 [Opisthorchis felineus]
MLTVSHPTSLAQPTLKETLTSGVQEFVCNPDSETASVPSELISGYPESAVQQTPPITTTNPRLVHQLLSKYIKLVERSAGCFICSACTDRNSALQRTTSFSDVSDFQAHISTQHAQLTQLSCVYCGWQVYSDRFVTHVVQHFLPRQGTGGIYACPVEPECSSRFCTNQFTLLEAHWFAQHPTEAQHQSTFKCPHCLRSFPTLSLWSSHLRRSVRSLVHCSAPGCFVKSPSRTLLLDHVNRMHTNNRSASVLLNETIEVVCNKQEVTPTKLDSSDTESVDGHRNLTLLSKCPSSSKHELEPTFVFLLRCPYCNMSTVRWNHFQMHASTCPTALRSAKASKTHQTSSTTYRCRVYWCSECQAVSTEKYLVTEHVTFSHEGKAVVVHEKLHIRLLDSNLLSVLPDPPLSQSTINSSAMPGAVGTNTLGSNATLFGSLYGNPVRPSSPEDDDETESPMNLAALARPSASKFGYAGRNQQSISSISARPSLQANTSCQVSSASVSWNPPGGCNTRDPSLSLLQSAAALKKLQEITATGCPDGTNMSASDAASAVAAMAAAALTGLTGFDVTNPLSSAQALPSRAPQSSIPGLTNVTSKSPGITSVELGTHQLAMAKKDKPLELLENSGLEAHRQCMDSTAEGVIDSLGCGIKSSDGARAADDLVSFPFDETKFRKELTGRIRPNILDSLVAKMHQFASYFVRILGKENHRRIPVCPECEKVFPYGLGDFKRHLLTVHLEVPREYLKDCLRFTYLPKSEEKFQEMQEQLAMRLMKPRLLEAGRRRVPLPYSIVILRRLTRHLPIATREFLEQKMQVYSRLSVIVDTRGGFRRYRCNHCSYSSPHALADVRKHILGSHCGISTKHFRHCLQASRLDPVEYTLFSDDKLARLARDFMHRRHGSEAFQSVGDRSPSPNDSASQNGITECDSLDSSPSRANSDSKSQDAYVSHFTAVVPGSKNRVTVRIRPPIPPDDLTFSVPSSVASPTNGDMYSHSSPPHSPESPESFSEFHSSTATVDNLDLNALSSIPGLEGADSIVDLSLPFSEPVLRQLMDAAGATKAHLDDMLAKMHIYSTYQMTRICKGDRTLAFRCPCGRLFITTRAPDLKIRAATLADSRRHVMGVHARIPHEFITICCQASRIAREYDFQIYPDDMLLRLAMDRPIKLTKLPPVGAPPSSRTSSSLPLPSAKPLAVNSPLGQSRTNDSSDHLDINSEGLDQSMNMDSLELQSNCSADGLHGLRDPNEDELASLADDKKNPKPPEDPICQLTLAQSSGTEEVERVINLPYSSDALHSLVEGYCPPSYFPVLEEKMDVYSAHKVFITRRRGRRYFCCSGCASSSPHGMGDIRKHILGVHAKVPERYKAAAMHCSRLSREDNTLLPNHVLLHLAKMKWKGTVIKPLADLDLSQFGTRRASAMGLVRPSGGQFASQVYQPSIQHRDSEKLTALSTTASSVKVNNVERGSSASPSKSPDYPATYDSNVPPIDVEFNHSGSEDKLDLGQFYIVRMNVDKDQSIAGHGSLVYACSVCLFFSTYVGAARAHVVRRHMRLPAHTCVYCHQAFKTGKEALKHHELTHAELDYVTGEQLRTYSRAVLEVPIKDITSESTERVVELQQGLRTQGLNRLTDEDAEDATLFENEMDEDGLNISIDVSDKNTSEDYLQSVFPSPAGFVGEKPAKVPRLEGELQRFSNGTASSSCDRTDLTVTLNGTGVKFSTPNNLPRVGLSGSSRRKPSKLQLVQLKPSTELDGTASVCPNDIDQSNQCENQNWDCSSPPELPGKLILDVGEV